MLRKTVCKKSAKIVCSCFVVFVTISKLHLDITYGLLFSGVADFKRISFTTTNLTRKQIIDSFWAKSIIN